MLSHSVIRSTLAVIAATIVAVAASPTDQLPLAKQQEGDKSNLIDKLKAAEIIPTIFDTFDPKYFLQASWTNASAEIGNTLDPSALQESPSISLQDDALALSPTPPTQLTIALTDPDAPSRHDPEWSQICHWVVTFVPRAQPGFPGFKFQVSHLMPYKPPGPPPTTGKHRYVFAALVPKNGTRGELQLSVPGDRRHWGFEGEGVGLREWAEENGLGVVAANFFYAQNDEQ